MGRNILVRNVLCSLSEGQSTTTQENSQMRRLILLATFVLAATPALAAEFYVVKNTATQQCSILQQRPSGSTQQIVGSVHSSKIEAEQTLNQSPLCNSNQGTQGQGARSPMSPPQSR